MSNHHGGGCAFTHCAYDLLSAAGSDVSRGIDAWNIGLELGTGLDELPLVEVDGVLHKRDVRVQPDENERRGGINSSTSLVLRFLTTTPFIFPLPLNS